jgi:hypothetical protein
VKSASFFQKPASSLFSSSFFRPVRRPSSSPGATGGGWEREKACVCVGGGDRGVLRLKEGEVEKGVYEEEVFPSIPSTPTHQLTQAWCREPPPLC